VKFRDKFLAVAMVLMLLAYGYISLNIRPIADDYCAAAAVSSDGVVEYMREIRRSWSGDFSQILAIAILVGLPIANLPMFMVGFTTLFLFILVFCYGMNSLLTQLTIFKGSSIVKMKTKIFILVLVLIAWGGYWSIPASTSLDTRYHSVLDANASFSAVFGWPVAIAAYLTIPAVVGSLLLIRPKSNLVSLIGALFLGLIIGTSGYAFATAVLSASIVFQLMPSFRSKFPKTLAFGLGISLGMISSITSPGANLRANLLLDTRPQIEMEEISRWVFLSFMELFASVFNLGILVTFVIALISTRYLIARHEILLHKELFQRLLFASAIFLFVYYGVISCSELLTYNAYWHLITFKSALFIFVYMFGVYVAYHERLRFFPNVFRGSVVQKSVLVIAIIIPNVAFGFESLTIIQRSDLWVKGSAPLPGIGDISPPGGWVDICWQDLAKSRQLPSRG